MKELLYYICIGEGGKLLYYICIGEGGKLLK